MTAPDLASGLSQAVGMPVSELSQSTAGARRTNVAFVAGEGSTSRRLVATIVPAGLRGELGLGESSITAEADVRALAEQAGVAVPHVEFVTDDPSYVGGPLMISTFVDGETVPRRVLRLVEATPGLGDTLAHQLGESLARLHSVPVETNSDNPAANDLSVLAAEVEALPMRRPALEFGVRWLERNLPAPPPHPALVHGDVRNGNLIAGPDGLRAVLDWELAKRGGDPMEDVAWPTNRMWRFGNDHLEVGGFADRRALIQGYTQAGGTFDTERFEWWKVARTLWWALGLAHQARSYLSGDVPNVIMAASGRRVSEMEWDLLMLTRPRPS